MNSMNSRPIRVSALPALLLTLLGLAACSPADVLQIEQERQLRELPALPPTAPTGSDRFGSGPGRMGASDSLPANPFKWAVPEGWVERDQTSLRLINFGITGDPGAECYVTVLPNDGGGLTANVNRWRSQFALSPYSSAEVAAMPRMSLLGESATIVDLHGTFTGMGRAPEENWGLMGVVITLENLTLFVKMTGPEELVERERQNFEHFCSSLTTPGSEPDPHAGHDHAPGEGHDDEVQASSSPGGDKGFVYSIPEGWREGPPKMMREVNLVAGETSQCYLVALPGEAGGLAMNINRWLGEMSAESLDQAGIDQLPRIQLFGEDVHLVEASGSYSGMGGPTGDSMTLLAVPLIRPSASIFVKMVGPADEVAAERENFLTFVASLRESN